MPGPEHGARPRRALGWLVRGDGIGARALRFAGVGGLSSLAYVVLAGGLSTTALPAVTAAALAYLVLLPVNFVAHRHATFRSTRPPQKQIGRFAVLHLASFGAATGGMAAAVTGFGLSPWIGAASALVLVPLASFLAMQLWVFR